VDTVVDAKNKNKNHFADGMVVFMSNRICNKILDRDWFSAHLFVTKSARDHVGVQLKLSNYEKF